MNSSQDKIAEVMGENDRGAVVRESANDGWTVSFDEEAVDRDTSLSHQGELDNGTNSEPVLGRAVQVDRMQTRLESAYGSALEATI